MLNINRNEYNNSFNTEVTYEIYMYPKILR